MAAWKIYKISQTVNQDNENACLCAIVVAQNKKDAKRIHPCGFDYDAEGADWEDPTWVKNTKDIKVEYLGVFRGNLKGRYFQKSCFKVSKNDDQDRKLGFVILVGN